MTHTSWWQWGHFQKQPREERPTLNLGDTIQQSLNAETLDGVREEKEIPS